jgi:hypothetical protein
VDLQAVKTSINMWTGSLKEDITNTKKDFHKAAENTRTNLYVELHATFRAEAMIIKAQIKMNQERMEAKIKATQCEFQTQLKEVKAGAEHRRGTELVQAWRSHQSLMGRHHTPCSGASSRP